MSKNKAARPFLIIAGAIVLLFLLSLVPWGDLTGNRLKNFNLLSDLFHGSEKVTAEEPIDPELEKALADADIEPATDTNFVATNTDGISLYQVASPKEPVDNHAADGTVIFEDYTVNGQGLRNFKRALASASTRPVRVAVIGDSYIEGDILTQDIREALQNRYGGAGVGYLPVWSEVGGFRTSVKQTSNGWTKYEIRKKARDNMKILQGEYFKADAGAKATFKGVGKPAHLDSWNTTTVLAVAPSGGSVTLTTDAGTETLELPAEDIVSALTISGLTTSATVTATPGVEIAGLYLDNATGVAVDNMSLRGNSGQTHRKLSVERAAQMRPYIDYDLIVVEYGINALSSQQSDYNGYKKLMMQTISRLRDCYPKADILMMSIGDRGQKIGGEVHSVPTSNNMVTAQRDAARQTGILFWDTREAMGGDDAVLTWREKGLVNPDYIHLNAKGGRAMSDLFMKALNKAL